LEFRGDWGGENWKIGNTYFIFFSYGDYNIFTYNNFLFYKLLLFLSVEMGGGGLLS
jgi:hypothetical protein